MRPAETYVAPPRVHARYHRLVLESKLGRILRSRRLALWLLVALMLYAAVATLVPQGGVGSDEVKQWTAEHPRLAPLVRSVGFHQAYSLPPFLAMVTLLVASTGFCAAERTRHAIRLVRRRGRRVVAPKALERLRSGDGPRVPVPPDLSPEEALDRAAARLSALRLAPSRDGRALVATAGHWGMIGSAVFHWAVTTLIVVIAVGQASQASGRMGLVLGDPTPDAHTSYDPVREGPLYGERHSGLDFVAEALVPKYVVDGVDRGPTPLIAVYDRGRLIVRQHVYPNNPIRIYPLLVHREDFGLAAVLAVEDPAGRRLSEQKFLFELDPARESGTVPMEFDLLDAGGEAAMVAVAELHADRIGSALSAALPKDPRVDIEARPVASTGPSLKATLRPRRAMSLPAGYRLRLLKVSHYVYIAITDDWSDLWIYGLSVVAVIGLSVALAAPRRGVIAAVVDTDDGASNAIAIAVIHSRRDPLFGRRVARALEEAFEPADGVP